MSPAPSHRLCSTQQTWTTLVKSMARSQPFSNSPHRPVQIVVKHQTYICFVFYGSLLLLFLFWLLKKKEKEKERNLRNILTDRGTFQTFETGFNTFVSILQILVEWFEWFPVVFVRPVRSQKPVLQREGVVCQEVEVFVGREQLALLGRLVQLGGFQNGSVVCAAGLPDADVAQFVVVARHSEQDDRVPPWGVCVAWTAVPRSGHRQVGGTDDTDRVRKHVPEGWSGWVSVALRAETLKTRGGRRFPCYLSSNLSASSLKPGPEGSCTTLPNRMSTTALQNCLNRMQTVLFPMPNVWAMAAYSFLEASRASATAILFSSEIMTFRLASFFMSVGLSALHR